MTNFDPIQEKATHNIVFDAYKIKLYLKPGDLGEEAPLSWIQVLRQINRHMMRLCVAPIRLAAEVLEGATRLIRGTSQLPNTVVEKIRDAHDLADSREEEQRKSHRDLPASQANTTDIADASMNLPVKNAHSLLTVAQIEDILKKYTDQGLNAYAFIASDGRLVIVVGTTPGTEEEVRRAIEKQQESESDRPAFLRKIMD